MVGSNRIPVLPQSALISSQRESLEDRFYIYFRFADDIVVNAEEEADGIVSSMDASCTR